MDTPRHPSPSRRVRRLAWIALPGAALLVTLGVSQLRPASPSVQRSALWTGVVERGDFVRRVRAPGTLEPEAVRWLPAPSEANVERIAVLPGAAVSETTVVLELSNPEVVLAARDADWALRASEAQLVDLHARLESERLDQRARVVSAAAALRLAGLQAETDRKLADLGVVSELTMKLSQAREEETAARHEIERERAIAAEAAARAQVQAKEIEVDKIRALHALKGALAEGLRVRAGMKGVLQEIRVEPGQRVAAGTVLARVVEPSRLQAELRVPAGLARDVQPGLAAAIDTRNGVVAGRVTRVDPAVRDGAVMVDVAFDGALPRGARPQLVVDGTIEIERVAGALHVGRPSGCSGGEELALFRIAPGGRYAERVAVRLGRASSDAVEILDGLAPGDEVILSDMSPFADAERLRLK